MYFVWNKINIFYQVYGDKGPFLLFLHGWGGNHQSFLPFYSKMNKYKIIAVDFPPFGNSSEPETELTIFDYAEMINALLDKLRAKKVKVICHSFGGRVAILLEKVYNKVDKLVLIDSAGLKPKKSLVTRCKIFKYKFCKKLHIKQKEVGSKDYKVLSTVMKKTFVNIVNRHLDKQVKEITCPTLIIWGAKDKDTPLYMATRFHKYIKNSELIIFKNAGHFAYLDNFLEIKFLIQKFLKNKR